MSILSKIFGTGIKETVSSIGDVVDKFIDTGGEKAERNLKIQELLMSHEQKLAEQVQAEVDAYLKDIQSARDANVRIQESDKASWLSKNFAYFLDGLFCILFGIMLFMIFKREVPVSNKELFYTGFGLLGGIV